LIRFQRPQLPPGTTIDRYLELARDERWFSNGGPCWRLLRERLSDRVGAYCTPVASGTLGLMTALSVLLGKTHPEEEALMPAFTFVATAQAAIWSGLRPRLHDIDREDWHLAPDQLEESLARNLRARVAIAVSAFGTPPPVEHRTRWELACKEAGVPLVIDSAAAFGAIGEDGTPIGAQGDVEIVSFHATKPFAIGEGGAIFTRDRNLHERIDRQVNFAFRPDHSVASAHGLNAKMSELHAATALAVLDDFDLVLSGRREAAKSIRKDIGDRASWQVGCERSTWQFVPLAFERDRDRSSTLAYCRDKVETKTYYQPLQQLLPRNTLQVEGGTPQSEDLYGRILCLPMANDLTEGEIATISAAVVA
jgi:dTDP-4-amino-4,6-dideoxygalactose transaminase